MCPLFSKKNFTQYEEDMQLELVKIEEDIKWWDIQLKNEHILAPQSKLDLLKKKWSILTGLKNNIR